MNIGDQKARLRTEMAARRDAMAPPDGADGLLARFSEHVLPLLEMGAYRIVSAYWPMATEADIHPIAELLHERGFGLALPAVAAKGRPLSFRIWAPGESLAQGVWNIPVPLEDAPEVDPDALLVPLLAFDESGYRLGYGGGFYDRTLNGLRTGDPPPLAVGVGFECQKVPAVPHADWDERLDLIITEAACYTIRKPAS